MRPTLFIVLILLESCVAERKQHEPHSVTSETLANKVLPETQVEADRQPDISNMEGKKIVSVTDTLFKGDTLRIQFKTPHPRDFAIRSPDNKFFFVVYAFNDPAQPSLIDWREFESLASLEIVTDHTTANPWDANETKNKLIFTTTGKYELLLSSNLETEGSFVEVAQVYYYNEERK